MKKIFLLAAILICSTGQLLGQNAPYKVVFDITTGDTATHSRVIRWLNSISTTHPDAKLEVVFYGKALPMVETNLSTVAGEVKKLATGKNVVFAVCEQAMKAHQVDKSMLLPGVQTVHDAIYELISKQSEGYGYIKVTN